MTSTTRFARKLLRVKTVIRTVHRVKPCVCGILYPFTVRSKSFVTHVSRGREHRNGRYTRRTSRSTIAPSSLPPPRDRVRVLFSAGRTIITRHQRSSLKTLGWFVSVGGKEDRDRFWKRYSRDQTASRCQPLPWHFREHAWTSCPLRVSNTYCHVFAPARDRF